VSIKASSYKNFQHALSTGNLMLVRAAAAELPSITLDDALTICVLLGDQEPHRYERATVRWLGRFCLEKREVTLADVREAAEAFRLLPTEPEGACGVLRELCAGP